MLANLSDPEEYTRSFVVLAGIKLFSPQRHHFTSILNTMFIKKDNLEKCDDAQEYPQDSMYICFSLDRYEFRFSER